MTPSYQSPKDRFAASGKLVWTCVWASIILQILALAVAGKDGIPVLVVGVPIMVTAAMAWSGITNWAEVRGIDAGYGQPPPDYSRQSVVVNPPPVPPKVDAPEGG